MNIIFDANTREALVKNLEEKNKSAVRLMVRGFGWGGPILGVALDEPNAEDEIITVNGVKFAIEPDSSYLFDNSKIVYTKGIFGKGFNVIPAGGNKGC